LGIFILWLDGASDYNWGWAPFHYGRWAYDPFYGWMWVPAMNGGRHGYPGEQVVVITVGASCPGMGFGIGIGIEFLTTAGYLLPVAIWVILIYTDICTAEAECCNYPQYNNY